MSTGSYNERRGRKQRHYGEWVMVLASVFVLFAFIGQLAYAQVAPPPGTVTVKINKAMGPGCQPGTLMQPEIFDNQLLTLSYSDYTAEDGVGIPAIEARKNCNIILDIVYPPSYRFGISAVKFKGFADLLNTNTEGTLVAQYFFQGQSPQVEFVLQNFGPIFNNYDTPGLTPTPTSGPVMFGPCSGGGTLNINTEVRVQGTGILTADTTTGTFQQIYTLVWQQC